MKVLMLDNLINYIKNRKLYCIRDVWDYIRSDIMTYIYFPDEEITTDDLYFICYMIERVARKLHQRN